MRRGMGNVGREAAWKLRLHCGMKSLVTNFAGWLASLLFVAVAIALWGGASLLVFLSGNGTLQAGADRTAVKLARQS